jgi:hypothetical protein
MIVIVHSERCRWTRGIWDIAEEDSEKALEIEDRAWAPALDTGVRPIICLSICLNSAFPRRLDEDHNDTG